MAYEYYEINQVKPNRGDCVIRAIAKIMNMSWDDTYWELCEKGYHMGDWGNSNEVWDSYLRDNGFVRKVIPNTCPDCYTIKDFCREHPNGKYIVSTGNHVVAIEFGNYFDAWDSGNECPIFYYGRRYA